MSATNYFLISLLCQYDTIVFISCQAIKTKKWTTNIAFGTLHKYH